jgi:hypothetical protein
MVLIRDVARAQLAVTAAGVLFGVLHAAPRVETSGRPQASGPVVLIDEAHHNFHRVTGSYGVVAEVIRADGFVVRAGSAKVTDAAVSGVTVFVSANPLAEPRQALVEKAKESGEEFQWSAAARSSAFTPDEIGTLQRWVRGGGGLLLVLDHPPFGGSGAALAAAFGVDVRNAQTTDPAHQENNIAGRLVFSRETSLIGDHPVTQHVTRVISFLGTSIAGPSEASVLLRLSPTAVDREWRTETRSFITLSAKGRAQGLALTVGRGRVIVLGEAGLFAAEPGSNRAGSGENGVLRPDVDTRRFASQAVRWLSGGTGQEERQ